MLYLKPVDKDWGYISLILGDMRRVLYDISEEGAQFAFKNVFLLSEHVKKELLDIFMVDLGALMDHPDNEDLGTMYQDSEVAAFVQQWRYSPQAIHLCCDRERMPDSKFPVWLHK